MSYQTQILEAKVEYLDRPFIKPLQLSTGLITEITEARASVTAEVNGKQATGYGSIYLSDLWAWPLPALSHDQRDKVLRGFTQRIADNLWEFCGNQPQHPLELGLRLHNSIHHEQVEHADGDTAYAVPMLAKAMCASPFDAALHDAVGIALEKNAFDFYDEPVAIPAADPYFNGDAAGAIARTLQQPLPALDAWLVVGAKDDLETVVAPWVRDRGYRCFKLKILGQDNAADVARTVDVYRAVRSFGAQNPRLSIDSNEANPSADAVLDYLEQLRAADSEAYEALEYLEQPTGRDITLAAFDWSTVNQLKPVLLDEGLTSLELLNTAAEQGWSGLALKTCKGHSFALVAAAWAHERGLKLAMQDLTNPGLSAIHSALFASRVNAFNGVELNSPQYTPAANADWLPRLSALLEPRDGQHRIPEQPYFGLGSSL